MYRKRSHTCWFRSSAPATSAGTTPVKYIVPDHYVVEKIINHKGAAARPNSMHLFVKWLGYDDKENSWIKWDDNQDLAAIDTYLQNSPDIEVPIFKKRTPKIDKTKKEKQKKAKKAYKDQANESEKYYCIFYLPSAYRA